MLNCEFGRYGHLHLPSKERGTRHFELEGSFAWEVGAEWRGAKSIANNARNGSPIPQAPGSSLAGDCNFSAIQMMATLRRNWPRRWGGRRGQNGSINDEAF